MKKMTFTEYKRKLKAKFGKVTIVGGFDSCNKSALHRCPECKNAFLATPHSMLHYKLVPTCVSCSRKKAAQTQTTPRAEFISKLKVVLPNITCKAYSSNNKAASFKCKCGNLWKAKPYEILKAAVGCPKCAKQQAIEATRIPKEEIINRLAIKGLLLASDKRTNKRVEVQCKKCKHTWSANPQIITPGNSNGCPECYLKRKEVVLFSDKKIKLGQRWVVVQGYEPEVLNYLTKKKGIAAEKIKVASEGIPAVTYVLHSVEHLYYPDIKIGNTLIEVKSTYTLFADLEKNKAKAKACLGNGFKFKMVVVFNKKVLALPAEWITWKKEKIESYLQAKARGTIVILALDPGSTNFGWSILRVSKPFKVEVCATGTINNPIKSMAGKEIMDRIKLFREEIVELVQEFKVDHIIAERYMTRGLKGATIELVSVMITVALFCIPWKKDNLLWIPAAQWKNEFNKTTSLEEFYKTVTCVDHQVDATMIGVYGAHSWYDLKPFSAHDIESLRNQINQTNLGKIINEPKRNNRSKNKDSAAPKRTARARKSSAPQAKDKPVRGRGRKTVTASAATKATRARTSTRKQPTRRKARSSR